MEDQLPTVDMTWKTQLKVIELLFDIYWLFYALTQNFQDYWWRILKVFEVELQVQVKVTNIFRSDLDRNTVFAVAINVTVQL